MVVDRRRMGVDGDDRVLKVSWLEDVGVVQEIHAP